MEGGLTGCELKFTVACFNGWKTGQYFRPPVRDSNQGLLTNQNQAVRIQSPPLECDLG